jgi:pimeloyl-ACP methyl ester carboxylesterase
VKRTSVATDNREHIVFRERLFTAGGQTINLAEGPANGAPILVLHGIPNRWQGMYPLMASLAARWHVFACDLRGHGKSGRATSYRAVDYFPDVAAVIATGIGTPTVVLGHSGGAMAALGAAALVPELARAVVLLDPPFAQRDTRDWPRPTSDLLAGVREILLHKRKAEDLLKGLFPGIGTAQIEWFTETFSCVDMKVIDVLLEGHYFEDLDLGNLLKKVTCPVLMLNGEVERGGLVRESDIAFLLNHASVAKVEQIKGSGHFLHAEQPQRILDIAEKWLADLDGA